MKGSKSPTYLTGCAGLSSEGVGSFSFEAALAAAEQDGAELVVAAVTTLFRLSHVGEFPVNVAQMAVHERERFDAIEDQLRERMATSVVEWRLERRTGELVDALATMIDDVGATKVFVGIGIRVARRLHIDVAMRLRRRVRCEVIEVDTAIRGEDRSRVALRGQEVPRHAR